MTAKWLDDILLHLDRIWCVRSLLSAEAILPLCDSLQETRKLAYLRVLSIFSALTELIGLFLLIYGSMQYSVAMFASGVTLKIIGHLGAGVLHNRSGIFLSVWWERHLSLLHKYMREFSGYLNQKGLIDTEIKSLRSLPAELYSTEINSYPYSFFINLWTPIICAAALAVHGELASSLLIAFIGMLALPLGGIFYRQFSFWQQRQQRLAQSANEFDYLEICYKKHLSLTFKVNLITQIPLILFTVTFSLGISSAILSNYLAFTMGLAGLTGLLAFQKLRVGAQATVEKGVHLLSALTEKDFLLTDMRYKEHIEASANIAASTGFSKGIIINDFAPKAFGAAKHPFAPISCSLPAGSVFLLQAPSGHGKSTLLLAILHIIDHKGEIYYVENGVAHNIHSLKRNGWEKRIVFHRESDLLQSARLIDLCRNILKKHLSSLYQQMISDFGFQLGNLAWNASDNLIEQEIVYLEKGSPAIFPKRMKAILLIMRQKRIELLKTLLNKFFGNNSRVYPERVFCTLSSGEQRRFVNLLTIEEAMVKENVNLVILDEPLAHLDEHNILDQLQQFREFQHKNALPLLIISHHHIDEICLTLQNVSKGKI